MEQWRGAALCLHHLIYLVGAGNLDQRVVLSYVNAFEVGHQTQILEWLCWDVGDSHLYNHRFSWQVLHWGRQVQNC